MVSPGSGTNGSLQFDAEIDFGTVSVQAAFEIEAGKTMCIAGPSGAGKSTCLSMIAGLLIPKCGTVVVGERTLTDTSQSIHTKLENRGVGLMSQDYSLFPHLTALENIMLGAHRLAQGERRSAALEWLNKLELSESQNQRPNSLSGGQQQRIALARTLISRPTVLLLDEPFAALDQRTHAAMLELILLSVHESEIPAVLVTHDRNDMLACTGGLMILENGRITRIGAAEEIFAAPISPFERRVAQGEPEARY